MSKDRKKDPRSVTELIRSFRSLQYVAYIPDSAESEDFLAHLQRMGAHVEQQWPPPPNIPKDVDVVFIAVRSLIEDDVAFNWDVEKPIAALIAVADYENPLIVEAALKMNVQATIGMPFRPFGLMINVLSSIANFKREQKLSSSLAHVRSKLPVICETEKAKLIVSQKYAVDGDAAYGIIRKHAMDKRVSVELIVQAINSADEVLNMSDWNTPCVEP